MKCAPKLPVEQRDDLRRRVDDVGRKVVAERLGVSYASLAHRLTGFLPLTLDYATKIEAAIDPQV